MSSNRPWVIAAPTALLAPLAPLLSARAARQPVIVLESSIEAILADPGAHLPAHAEALLVVGPPRRGPRRSLPGLWVHDAVGSRVPVGWLPGIPSRLSAYAAAAARVLARPPRTGPLVVLGQWEDRFLRVALRTSRWFEKQRSSPAVFHWTADRVTRNDMIEGLGFGPGLALYFGHGRARGWAGYHGVRIEHFPALGAEPLGSLLALCCENASRQGGRLSFAEDLVLQGICAGALAAAGKTRHEDNRQLGPALNEAMTARHPKTLASLVDGADLPPGFWEKTPYRFIGDPAASLAGAVGATEAASLIFAPAPDDPLPPWPDEDLDRVPPLAATAAG